MMGRSTALFPEAGRPVMRKRRLFACDPEEHVTCLAESLTAFINFLHFMMIFLKRCFIIDIDSAEIWFR